MPVTRNTIRNSGMRANSSRSSWSSNILTSPVDVLPLGSWFATSRRTCRKDNWNSSTFLAGRPLRSTCRNHAALV